jgi:hypothetical protein
MHLLAHALACVQTLDALHLEPVVLGVLVSDAGSHGQFDGSWIQFPARRGTTHTSAASLAGMDGNGARFV